MIVESSLNVIELELGNEMIFDMLKLFSEVHATSC